MRTYKPFWQGTTWVLSIPSQICQALGIKRGDKLLLVVEDGKLILTRPKDAPKFRKSYKISDSEYLVTVRVIGAEGMKGKYDYTQLGFTVPSDIVTENVSKTEFEVVLEEKTRDSFKIVYSPLKKEN